MVAVVVSSNILVQYPVQATIGGLDLADLLTWGAFTYPAAFLVTDLTNRRFGVAVARRVIVVGFLMAVVLSVALATPRIAIASATAFLVGQLLDVTVFDRLRRSGWWKAPFVGSLLGSATDTTVFFSLAFAGLFGFLGAADPFSAESATLLGTAGVEAARWVSWALADFSVKLAFAALFLVPYRLVMNLLWPIPDRMATAA
ncbi:queuosine precursor transporter [Pinisolibacter aquiterrae]|uniref:queuosine precursor transporter n=1 Tax=Pinisolibacter aquiterrae TaxID=2815579 RepID=UPI001C3C59ED|nr:queuosine precursor transporter [Pinisolibacter aquiterrae]MBV5262762.1 queuosine precursor transporter [Pinisolibacter aquiterrae]MCC8233582.1 queuosine precursor transporter [Pinisolibacter aquiterrae]